MASKMSIARLILKILLFVFGITLLVVGGFYITAAFNVNRTLKAMKQPLVQMPIVFSIPSEYAEALPSMQDCFQHGIVLGFEVGVNSTVQTEPEELLEGLRGKAVITKEDGDLVGEIDFIDEDFLCRQHLQRSADSFYFTTIKSFPVYVGQNCRLSVKITQGALKLEGKKQMLELRYHFCGLESLYLLIHFIIGVVPTMVGLAITIPMLIHIVKRLNRK
ncbi:MAG: hypothetical protein ACYTBP_16425 [Planctomycetota bacterium]|jgi:hypothetical protein